MIIVDKKARLKYIMPMTGNSTSSDKILAADNIINKNMFNLSNYFDIYVDTNSNWETENNSRSLRRWLHTHIFLSDFTRAYAETKDDRYFEESFRLIENWFMKFPIQQRKEIDELAYHEEGTAIRLLFWFKYYNQFIELFNEKQIKLFETKIDETALLLSDEEFYAGINNHGMFQDMGLLAYSLFKYDDFSTNNVFNLALNRIENYFKEIFTKEGIHKEHAPSYHILLLHSLKQILQTLDKIGYSDQRTKDLNEILIKGEEYIVNVTMPDFKLPNISDSTQINMSTSGVYKNLFESEEYKYITSAGKIGDKPKKIINVYPDTGYLIARNSWEKDSVYFLFLASYHMHYHKHTDDLSFILYKKGPIFVDAGPYSYNYKDPMTQYAYSQYAHSTLIVNNNSLPRTDFKFENVKIKSTNINEDQKYFNVEGVNTRYENVQHLRNIKGDLQTEQFRIKDTIISNTFNRYQLLFQIDGNLKVFQNGEIYSIFKNNSKIAELEISNHDSLKNLKTSVIREQNLPKIMGYQFPKTEKIAPLNTIIIDFENNDDKTVVESIIRLSDFKISGSATFERREKNFVYGDISYIYEDFGNKKLAVVFQATETEYRYPIENMDIYFNKEDYNILYIRDTQFPVGSSFIKGKSNSTIESDIESIINRTINKYDLDIKDVLLFGYSKAGFAALYYGLKNYYRNIIAISPLSLIGEYYLRHKQYGKVIEHLNGGGLDGDTSYLNDYIFNLDISTFPKNNKVYIGVGEKDYHKEKHITPIIDLLEDAKINYTLEEFKGLEFKDTRKFISDNLQNILTFNS